MAKLLYHDVAKQYYIAPCVNGEQQTIYLGHKEHAAQSVGNKILSKINKFKKRNKKRKVAAGEKILKMLEAQEKRKRANKPAMFRHKHSLQYAVSVCVNGKKRMLYFGKEEKIAEQKYHEFLAQYKKDRQSVVSGRGAFSELVNKYLENVKDKVFPSTLRGYRLNLKVFLNFAPGVRINEINHELLDRFKAYLLNDKIHQITQKQGVSRATVNRYLTNIKTVMNWGLLYDKISHVDIKIHKVKKEPVKRPLPRFLNTEEIQKILNYKEYLPKSCNKLSQEKTIPQLVEIIKFLLVTGRRIQEVVNLKKKDVALADRRYVITKDKTERTNPVVKVFHLNDAAIEIITPLYEAKSDEEYIFSDEHGRKLSIKGLGQRLKRLLSHLGIEGVMFKEFRHSFASHMRMAGEPLENIRDHLGHTTIKTTEIYAHIGENHLRQSINIPAINALIKSDTTFTAQTA